MIINVRDESEETTLQKVVFGKDGEYLEKGNPQAFYVSDGEDSVWIYIEDIDYLITALQKAKEAWA